MATVIDKHAEPWDEDEQTFSDDITIDETSTIDTDTRHHLKNYERAKRENKDFYSYKRRVFNEDGEYVFEKVEVYSTPLLTNGLIRNAVSGAIMNHRVGSKYDDLYFRMMDVTGIGRTKDNYSPRKLYYNDPEQCERHLGITISQEMKNTWLEKRMKVRK